MWRDRFEAGDPYTVSSVVFAEEVKGGRSVASVEAVCPDPYAFFFDPITPIYDDVVDYDTYEAESD